MKLFQVGFATARLSDDGRFRYYLTRRWGEGPALGWVMLNPSTADATTDDATIRRVLRFTEAAGYHALEVVNLYAWRARDRKVLVSSPSLLIEGRLQKQDGVVSVKVIDARTAYLTSKLLREIVTLGHSAPIRATSASGVAFRFPPRARAMVRRRFIPPE